MGVSAAVVVAVVVVVALETFDTLAISVVPAFVVVAVSF